MSVLSKMHRIIFLPVTRMVRMKYSYGKISSPLTEIPAGWKNRDLGNRTSPPSQMNTTKFLQRIGFRGKVRSQKKGP